MNFPFDKEFWEEYITSLTESEAVIRANKEEGILWRDRVNVFVKELTSLEKRVTKLKEDGIEMLERLKEE